MTKTEVKAIIEALASAKSTNNELRQISQNWLAAFDTGNLHDVTVQLLAGAEECLLPIDGLIAFTASEAGVKLFGAELAKQLHDHGVDIKAKGADYCDCPACLECLKLIEHKDAILALF